MANTISSSSSDEGAFGQLAASSLRYRAMHYVWCWRTARQLVAGKGGRFHRWFTGLAEHWWRWQRLHGREPSKP